MAGDDASEASENMSRDIDACADLPTESTESGGAPDLEKERLALEGDVQKMLARIRALTDAFNSER